MEAKDTVMNDEQIEKRVNDAFAKDALLEHYVASRGHWERIAPIIALAQAELSFKAGEESGIAKGRAEVVEGYKENCPHYEGDRAWMKSDCHVCRADLLKGWGIGSPGP